MGIIEKGTAPHSYIIKIFGIRIRFRNKFNFKNNKVIIVDQKGKEHKKNLKALKLNF